MLMNVSSCETLDLSLSLPESAAYGLYDAMADRTKALATDNGSCSLTLVPYESIVIVTEPDHAEHARIPAGSLTESLHLTSFDLTLNKIGAASSEIIKDFKLVPVSSFKRDFSGELIYTTKFSLDTLPLRAAFSAQYVFECMELTVNGKALPLVYVPPYEQEITEALCVGENEIRIRVATTALRNANTKPGIFGKERTILEPTGMFGRVEIKLYE